MILITGGAGYIGSCVNKLFSCEGYETIVYDNLVYGHKSFVKWGEFIHANLSDADTLNSVFDTHEIDAVIHLAAYAYVGESVDNPSKYYNNNVINTIRLLDAMRSHNCNKLVFSSSCTVYGVPESNPIAEDMPKNPISPYGRTKRMIEMIIEDYAHAYGLKYAILRYFNAAGGDPDSEIGEWHVPETHLIPLVLDAAAGVRASIQVYGTDYSTSDGTCIRDYIDVTDLADAHLKALRYLNAGNDSIEVNLGNNEGYSVIDIIDMVKKVTGKSFRVDSITRRSGDPDELVGSNLKAKDVLGWFPKYNLESIVSHAWNWYQKSVEVRS
jgi:UDP-glucose 4-epimerase